MLRKGTPSSPTPCEDREGSTLAGVIEETADELRLVTSGEDPVIVDR